MKNNNRSVTKSGKTAKKWQVIYDGRAVQSPQMFEMILLAKRYESSGYGYLFLDEESKRIYRGIEDKNFGGAVEALLLEEDYFKDSTIEEFADMLWYELGWSVNVNNLNENKKLQKLFVK